MCHTNTCFYWPFNSDIYAEKHITEMEGRKNAKEAIGFLRVESHAKFYVVCPSDGYQ
jgi:hypothetical protein